MEILLTVFMICAAMCMIGQTVGITAVIVCCGAVAGATIHQTATYARGIATTTTRPTATTTSAFVVPILNNISDRELYGAFGEKRSPDLFRL